MVDSRQLALTVAAPSPGGPDILLDGIEHLIRERWDGLTYELLVRARASSNSSPCPESFKYRLLVAIARRATSRRAAPSVASDSTSASWLPGSRRLTPRELELRTVLERISTRRRRPGADSEIAKHCDWCCGRSTRKPPTAAAVHARAHHRQGCEGAEALEHPVARDAVVRARRPPAFLRGCVVGARESKEGASKLARMRPSLKLLQLVVPIRAAGLAWRCRRAR